MREFFKLALILQLLLCAPAAWAADKTAQIFAGSKELFEITGLHSLSPEERARLVNARIDKILRDSSLSADQIEVRELEDGTPAIVLGQVVILEATAVDAGRVGLGQQELAERWSGILRRELGELEPLYLRTAKFDIKMLTEHNVLLFILQIAILLMVATIFGEISARLRQPPVIGQLFAGVFLGHSVLGRIFPHLVDTIFPADRTQSFLLEVVSWIGVIFLLMLTGMETDWGLVRKECRSAVGSIVFGVVVPFAAGAGLAFALPASLFSGSDNRLLAGLFIGTVFSVSSVPVVAKILMEMDLLRGKIGQLILTTSLCQDIIGCLMLAVVAAFADADGGGLSRLWLAPVGTLGFILVLILSRPLVFQLVRVVNDRSRLENPLMTLVVVLLFASAAATHFIGVHVVLGAFGIGVLLAQSPLITDRVIHPLRSMTMSVFAPIFFAVAGLHVNIGIFTVPRLLVITLVLTLLACFSKIFGSYVGCLLGRLSHWESLAVSSAANARGAMGLIVGILGFSLGIISIDLLSIIIIMSIVTTAIAPPMVRYCLSRVPGGTDPSTEDKTARATKSFVSRISRILVPTGGAGSRTLMLRLCAAISGRHPVEATLLHVSGSAASTDFDPFLGARDLLKDARTTLVTRKVASSDVAGAIVEEASRNYDLVIMGADKRAQRRHQAFGEVVHAVSEGLETAFLVVADSDKRIWPPRKVLIPTTGGSRASRAAELGVTIADYTGAQTLVACVLEKRPFDYYSTVESYGSALDTANDIVQNAAAMAGALDVPVETFVKVAPHAGPEIIRMAMEEQADLIVMSGSGRASAALFAGQTTQYVFANAPCPVVVLVA
ncbi:MAG: cation:proton antiporter [Candidatus Melainabacteria bacterium]|nr:cation:proton antiporter [Candidatus Melainabacteria bacterium]